MGLLELIKQRTIEEAKRISLKEGLEEGLEKGVSIERRKTITKMLSKKFVIETIADILEIPISEVQSVQQEVAIKALSQEKLDMKMVLQHFETTEQPLLLSEQQIDVIFAEVQVEQLLSEGLKIDEIVERLGLPKSFVMKIEKSR